MAHMANATEEKVEGLTLNVYVYIAKKRTPQGPRDVMRGMNLSSPSVAYRHLQKLENAGLAKKNEYGEYTVTKKISIGGFHWVGRTLLPRTMFYFFTFLGLLIAEVVVFVVHWQYNYNNYVIVTYYEIGIAITGIAMAFFLAEAIFAARKLRAKEGPTDS
jgi:hypothetical protein